MAQSTSVYVFGSGDCGQLGLGEDVLQAARPKLLPYFQDKEIIQVSAGGLHTLALDASGRVYSWGCNDEKALGHTEPEFQVGMVSFKERTPRMTRVSAGDSISVSLDEQGRIWSWGTFRDSQGVLGHTAASLFQEEPALCSGLTQPSSLKFVDIAAGANHLLALTEDRQIWAWGCGEQGQLGRRTSGRIKTSALRPTNVTPRRRQPMRVGLIVAGSYHSLFTDETGQILCAMGLNNHGQLGLGDNENRVTPEELDWKPDAGTKIIAMGAGEHHSLVLTSDGQCWATGRNDSGQLGIPSKSSLSILTRIPNHSFSQIATGGNHNLALSLDFQRLFSWGYGEMHQLGHGEEEEEREPREIASLNSTSKVLSLTAGGQHSVLLTTRQ